MSQGFKRGSKGRTVLNIVILPLNGGGGGGGRIFLPENILKRGLIFDEGFMGEQGRVGGLSFFLWGRESRYGHFY